MFAAPTTITGRLVTVSTANGLPITGPFQAMTLDEHAVLQPSPETTTQTAPFKGMTIYMLFNERQQEESQSYIGLSIESIGELFKVSMKDFQDPTAKV